MVEVAVLNQYPCLKERMEVVFSDSCAKVSMEMIVVGEDVRGEGRYGKAFVKV
jgi:hypothetical protein